MSYTIKKFDNEPILMITIHEDYNVATDQVKSDADVRPYFENTEEDLYHIINIIDLNISLDDIVQAANAGTRKEEALWKHPKHAMLILITQNPLAKVAAKGLGSSVFGSVKVRTFNTTEEALAWIREDIAERVA
ncbi:MAG: hypothetical protein AAFR81_30085 [Chloroflexota bacterium]